MVCPNCKHELNPLARVCPTCGTPVPGAQPAPVVAVDPLRYADARPDKKLSLVTGWRVFAVIFTILAMAANVSLVVFWFVQSVPVTADKSAASFTLVSMHEVCRDFAPYLTVILISLCVVSIVFLILPLLKRFSQVRYRYVVPKLAALLCAGCYAVPYVYSAFARSLEAVLDGGTVDHSNPFTTICLGLFVGLILAGEFSSRHRFVVQRRKIEALQDQISAVGLPPVVSE